MPICDGARFGFGLSHESCQEAILQIAHGDGDVLRRIVKQRGRGFADILLPRRWLSSEFSCRTHTVRLYFS